MTQPTTTEPDLTEAMEVWRDAAGAYEDGTAEIVGQPMRDMVIAGDKAAARVIATALESRDVYLREQLKVDEEILGGYKEREAEKDARIRELEEALTPSGDTKAAYMGEFSFNITETFFDEESETFEEQPRKVYVPWDTIKEIMEAIRARATLTKQEPKP